MSEFILLKFIKQSSTETDSHRTISISDFRIRVSELKNLEIISVGDPIL